MYRPKLASVIAITNHSSKATSSDRDLGVLMTIGLTGVELRYVRDGFVEGFNFRWRGMSNETSAMDFQDTDRYSRLQKNTE